VHRLERRIQVGGWHAWMKGRSWIEGMYTCSGGGHMDKSEYKWREEWSMHKWGGGGHTGKEVRICRREVHILQLQIRAMNGYESRQ
jgi:hypothetical protein